MNSGNYEYIGFWKRVLAALIDSVLVTLVIAPVMVLLYGDDFLFAGALDGGPVYFLLNWVFPALAIVAFWIARQATPGKMVVSARIVDARTGGKPGAGQLLLRYLGYYVSTIPLGLGLLWVAFDARKQGWHDKLAGTLVVRAPRQSRSTGQSPE